ncbi:MAG: substrate-binding periplasmic protein [Cognaticolwellia sp.]
MWNRFKLIRKNIAGFKAQCLVPICLIIFSPLSYAQQAVKILTNSWPPYINSPAQAKGSAAKLVDMLFELENIKPQWQYTPYQLAYFQVKSGQRVASFPYFKTRQRAQEVLYSAAVFSVTTKLYYNREFLTPDAANAAYQNKLKVGRVAGYSYGETIDKDVQKADIFASEIQALTALFNHKIDVLPMTEGVMNYHLEHNFPFRKQLILPLSDIEDTSNLHVIAAKNAQGAALIEKVNHALSRINAQGMSGLLTTNTVQAAEVDIAKLITTEGYPLITGQSAKTGDNIDYYTLPQGSKVLIVQWSEKILQPSTTDRIYKNMMDLSKVVLLNGPHVGKELYVRNMHIELQ